MRACVCVYTCLYRYYCDHLLNHWLYWETKIYESPTSPQTIYNHIFQYNINFNNYSWESLIKSIRYFNIGTCFWASFEEVFIISLTSSIYLYRLLFLTKKSKICVAQILFGNLSFQCKKKKKPLTEPTIEAVSCQS